MTEEKALTQRQQRALGAIIVTETLTDAAKLCGLSERTVYRYLDDETFNARLIELQRLQSSAVAAKLDGLLVGALEKLGRALNVLDKQVGATIETFIKIGADGKPVLDLKRAKKAGVLDLIKGLTPTQHGDKLALHDAQGAAHKIAVATLALIETRRKVYEFEMIVARLEELESKMGGAV